MASAKGSFFTIILIVFSGMANAQGWRAEISFTLYDAKIVVGGVEASVSFSGVSTIPSAINNPYALSLQGNGDINSSLQISITAPFVMNFSASDYGNCVQEEIYQKVGSKELIGSIKIYPRPIIAPAQPGAVDCVTGNMELDVSGCNSLVLWTVTKGNESRVIQSVTSSNIVINAALLQLEGFANPYGNIGVTATRYNFTSPQVTIEIRATRPSVQITPTDPVCAGKSDAQHGGKIQLTITPSTQAVQNFIVSLYSVQQGGSAISMSNISSTQHTFNVGAGTYWVNIVNNQLGFGDCGYSPRISVGTLVDKPPVTASLVQTHNISCSGYNDGAIQVIASSPWGTDGMQFAWGVSPGQGSNPRTNCSAGNYTLTAIDFKGCTSQQQNISLSQPAPLVITSMVSTHDYGGYEVRCHNSSDGGIDVTVIGGPGARDYYWNNQHINQEDRENLEAGVYEVEVRDGICTASAEITLDAPLPINFTFQDGNSSCLNALDGHLEVTNIQNVPGGPAFAWSKNGVDLIGETSNSLDGKGVGSYSVTVTDQVSQCSLTDNAVISPLPEATVQITVESDHNGSYISCNGESDGSLKATFYDHQGVEADPQQFQWLRNSDLNSFANSKIVNGLDAAEYKVRAQYATDCWAERAYNLLQPSPVTVSVDATSNYHGLPISCPGEGDGALLATASGGTPGGYTYQWTDGPPSHNFNDLTQGTYFVTVHDVNGCEAATSYQLNDPPPVVPAITIQSNYHGQPITCAGASDALLAASATGGAGQYLFKWNTGAYGMNLNNIPAGQYSVEATDANGCKVQTQPIIIIDPEPMNASITVLSNYNGQAIQCFDSATGSIRANGEGGTNVYSYLWSTNAITRDISGLIHGNYSVLVSDENGCSSLAAIELLNPEPVVATISDHSDFHAFGVQCHGSQNGFIEVAAVGGTNSFTFDWPSLSQTTNRVEDLAVGQYTVIVSDQNGCSDDVTFEITQPPLLTIEEFAHTDVNCFGGSDGALSVVSAGGAGIHEYSLNNGAWQFLPDFADLLAEVPYIVKVKDANQCEETFEIQLAQPDEIQIQFSVQPSLCTEPVGEVVAQVIGGVGDFTYEWRDENDNFISIYPTITKQFAGIYRLLVRDSHLCPIEQAVGVPSIDGPQLHVVENRQTSCFESSDGYARVEVLDGEGPFVIQWDDGTSELEVDNLSRGIHYASVTDVNHCAAVIPVVTISPEPIDVGLAEKIDASCYLSCDGSIELHPTGGNGEYTFSWNNNPGSPTLENLCSGLYTVDVTDKLGCTASQVFNIAQPDPLELRAVNRTLPSCNGGCNGSIEVIASGGSASYSYAWNSGSQSSVQQNICSGNYTVTATDSKKCAVSRTFDLGQPTKVQIAQIENKSPTCYNGCDGKIEVTASGGVGNYRFAWTDGSTSPKNLNLCVGENQVTVVDGNNCSVTEKYTIDNVPQLKIDLGGGIVVCEGQQHELSAGASWKKVEWRTGGAWISSSQSILISKPGTYDVKVEDANKCIATDSFVLETSEDLLEASFIIAAEAVMNDTIVMIDISWPLPDDITWKFPNEMEKLLDLGDVIHGKFTKAGDYDIVLHASLGDCRDKITKTIKILEDEKQSSGGRLGAEIFVKTFTLHPNPNTGTFEVEVEFSHESAVTMTIWNLGTTRLVTKTSDDGNSQYKKYFDLQPITSGTYLLRIDYNGGHRTIRFLVY